jgi:predicted phage baseplate assembly protein
VSALTPATLFNRPGLGRIQYRVGTHGSFLQTMKARLSSSELPKLAGLTTRDKSDAAIALLDAWAVVADVLTFYQERIASEGYLRTATERRSILELARLVGYRLRPGVASSVYLAYTLEPTQETTVIEAGNKAQSIPGPNETPQVFETADALVAHSSLNLLKLRLTQPQFFFSAIALENPTIVVKGASANVRVNDALALGFQMINPPQASRAVYRALEITPEPQFDRTTIRLRLQGAAPQFGSTPRDPAADTSAAIKAVADKYIDLDSFDLSSSSKIVKRVSDKLATIKAAAAAAGSDPAKVAKLLDDVRALFPELIDEYAFASNRGYDKIASWLSRMIDELEVFQASEALQGDRNGFNTIDQSTNPAPGIPSFVELFRPFKEPQSLQPRSEARLGRQVDQIYSGRSEFVAQVYATLQPQAAPFVKSVLVNANPIEAPTRLPKTEGVIQLTEVQAMRLKARLAGHNLPPIVREAPSNNGAATVIISPPNLGQYVAALGDAGFPITTPDKSLIYVALDGQYDQITPQSTVAIERPVIGVRGFTTTTHKVARAQTAFLTFSDVQFTCTVLTLDTSWLKAEEIRDGIESNAVVRSTTVFAQSETLAQTEVEMANDLIGAEGALIELDGLYTSLEPGRWVIIAGERVVRDARAFKTINTGVQVSELVMVASVSHEAKTLLKDELVELKGEKLHTFIRPAQTPAYSYRRGTVRIYGNVVRATHGETRNEVLGSGDGSKALQAFTLRQPPLTYLPAPTPSGTQSTLEVRVNDIRWGEADNLFALNGADRKYVTRTDDDGKTTVTFGNGERGARLPTGVENVKAVYRSGIGKVGNVNAGQIKLPLTKPLGVKAVINPLRSSGGADKETLVQARRNAPISVLALDRLVSVQDYADFARTFAGIAKASATRLSDGAREVVHLTVAGAGDIPIDPTSELYLNLVAALKRFGDPLQPLQVEVFERVLLVVSAKVGLHPDYLWESVQAKIFSAMFDEFGFENRELGQDVPQAEVLRVIQSVPGVNYGDLDLMDSVNEEKLKDPDFGAKLKLKPRVNASLARGGAGDDILPAQLVFLSPEAKDTLILKEQNERNN